MTGEFTRWSVEAARRALDVFAAMFGRAAEETLELATRAVTRRLFEEVVRREWSHEKPDLPEDLRFFLDKAFSDDGKALRVSSRFVGRLWR